jgi:paraquat-inducible protein B
MQNNNDIIDRATPAMTKEKRGISLIWIVPLVALVIGGWLAVKAIREQGPTITISFIHAEGLEAGKTKIKYRDVDVGQVESISLNKNLSHIEVKAKLVKGSERFLTDQTKFWVIRARVKGLSVTGLGTLLSGAYIGVEPHEEGLPTRAFTGLETPPAVTIDQTGRQVLLKAATLGSLEIGSPIYYHQIEVGEIIGYDFNPQTKGVDVKAFIEAPYDSHVTENTKFWNTSGIDVILNADGLKVRTQSVMSILNGGIAFDLPANSPPGKAIADGAVFRLYPDRESTEEKTYSIRNYFMLVFDQSVRGLTVGAPVEMYGIKVGEVVDLNLEFDPERKEFSVPVRIAIEPQRIHRKDVAQTDAAEYQSSSQFVRELIEQRGLRAQLQSGALLTGQLMISLVFSPDAGQALLTYRDDLPVIPTVPRSLQQLQDSLVQIINRIEKMPFDEIGNDVHVLLQDARSAINQISRFSQQLNDETAPQIQRTLVQMQNTLSEFENIIGNQSPLNYKVSRAFEELSQTMRSVRELVDTLDNRPQSIIFGKGEE